jgi:exodeoxyribonuclease VII small subunit
MSKSPRKQPAKPATEPVDPAIAEMGYEEAIDELEAIIERMEKGETGLEESLREYARGDALIRRCRAILDDAEQRIERITGDALEQGEEPSSAPAPF